MVAWAGCRTTASLNITDSINVGEILANEVSFSKNVVFTGISCDTSTDKIVYKNIQSDWVEVGPFGNGEKLKVKIKSLGKTSETIGKSSNAQAELPYVVKIARGTLDFTGERKPTWFLSDTVIANIGGESSTSIDFWLGICKTLNINWCVSYLTSKLAGDTFTLGLSISYYPKNTTCKPENIIIKVDDIALSQLRSQGKITANSKEGVITLKCDNLFGDKNQASRNMVVYLSSSDLVTGSNTILRGNIDNGVGFVLDLKEPPKGTEAAIKISASGNQGAATSLWKTDKPGTSLNSNIINIPIMASYYVYDTNKVKSGALEATALINVKYD
ncbi:fimbrial protein [Escherichia coli]|uniref:fimbrial protein n=1 Tax=Escherichia coli TaxID=562 RepID=UPI0028E0DD65|nr:fimbrial protein [Escherichia coli]MDT9483142.1 fimbrial protein [Escherichia coli]